MAGYSRAIFDRYLNLLGVARTAPSWEALAELTSAHLIRIPFENVSKIHRARVQGIRRVPSLEEYLDGVEYCNFGGTCYANNYFLHVLLDHLGFTVRLCGADISVNGAPPDGHMVNVVTVGGKEAIADVGYGAPFWQPIPLHGATDVIIRFGSEKYVLKPRDGAGNSRMELYRENQLRHGYVLKPAAKRVADFSDVIARSYSADAPFLNRLVLIRFFKDRALTIRNHTLTEMSVSESHSSDMRTPDDIAGAVVRHFGISASIISEVLESLGELKNSVS
ncbi:MAG TPA: arylamine N-acetyltransferase [Candidatus Deferrimicrobium sp.]|nr:arylamine N-acetyltransferase [Candidatus Deferrimicrobium sp.]